MQLPFVLQSAETMKTAVAYLEPHMEKIDGAGKGKIVLATVRGDVHDIGKNLVDIILSNNGYTTYNIGIKQPIQNIIDKANEVEADAIGLSGLLVKSTVVMREDLEELNSRELFHFPVLLGGAALTRKYVEEDLRAIYKGSVFYAQDAFEGLSTMDKIMPQSVRARPSRRSRAAGWWWPTRTAATTKPRHDTPDRSARERRTVGQRVRAERRAARRRHPAAAVLGQPRRPRDPASRHLPVRQRNGAVPRPMAVPEGRAQPARVRRLRRKRSAPRVPAPAGAGDR